MLDEQTVYINMNKLKGTFVNAFFTVQLSIPKQTLEQYVDLIIDMGKNIGKMVIHLTIQEDGINFLMDERFDLNSIQNFKYENGWTYFLDAKNLYKGYALCHHILPTVKMLSPIIWSSEGHA